MWILRFQILAVTSFLIIIIAIIHLMKERKVKGSISRLQDVKPIKHKREGSKIFHRLELFLQEAEFLKRREKHIKQELAKAGLPLRPSEFVCLRLILTISLFCIGLIISKLLLGGLILGLVGFLSPFLFLKSCQKKRLRAFNSQLVNALSLISNSLKAGYSFLQALQTVSEETSPPIKDEFGKLIRENSLGIPIEEALKNLLDRVPSYDLDLIVTSLLIQRQTGGNLAEILDNISYTIRERVRLRGEIRVLTAQGRMSGIIISVLPFAIYLILHLLHPDIYKMLYTNPIGILLIIIGIIMMGAGIFLVKKIVSIEV
ncbi:MAG: type II secretion system F family protein [bacterium]|nr:type II secretion system F family protein [bacterium]